MSNEISGGIFFNIVVQGGNITVQLPPQIPPALSGLPPASATFTGRDAQVEELLEILAPGEGQQEAVLVQAVAGLAGVGKTELVVQTAARALKQPGWFPGGVLFVDMFGYDTERRLSPERALDGLLRALGVPGQHIPPELQDRSRLYRSVLAAFAEQGRRILVVIDNASTAQQARPLLPSDDTTAALLTSRHTLDVEANLYDLEILDERASVELLRQVLLHARGPADTRVTDEPEHAATIARLCAGLPLALRIAAALLADLPTRPLASLAQAMEAAHTRLDRLRREDRAVRAAFDLSYQHLSNDHARLFRLLPLNPGPDISTESAAHLASSDQPHAEELLRNLARAHLVEPAPVWGRWRLHDLVRLYAEERGCLHADTDQRAIAQTRLHDYYRTTTQAADSHLQPLPSAPSPRFANRHQALAWLDDERLNLIATGTAPPPLGRPDTSTALAATLTHYLDHRGYFDDLINITTPPWPSSVSSVTAAAKPRR
ncbi:AAA family ATPase [Streptomyces ehimensis]|uniref:AAA family ATPase n=1 Tax=Streptomyces ehimensis TaxID=68195 RepID=A0ABV9BVW4_9ACTN